MGPRAPDEDVQMQNAIQLSLKSRTDNMAAVQGAPAESNTNGTDQNLRTRVSIDDMIQDLSLRAALELPLFHDSHGDTYLYIDPPEMQPEQDYLDYELYVKRYKQPILVKKEALVALNSPFFEKAFGPTAQFRLLRRRKLVDKLPPHVKYVIDLTPPSEGEEAVYLTTLLCCSEGVRLWYQSSEIWKVSKILVGGQEEYSSIRPKYVSIPIQQSTQAISQLANLLGQTANMPAISEPSEGADTGPSNAVDFSLCGKPRQSAEKKKKNKPLILEKANEALNKWTSGNWTSVRFSPYPKSNQSAKTAKPTTPSFLQGPEGSATRNVPKSSAIMHKRIPLEYTPVRHRSAIERVLAAIQGADPKLDSAPKMWTTFAVAKYFEITNSPLTDYIIRWLRAYPNSYFLEVLPEISLQIADGLQVYDLARDTFAILVGEEALDTLRRARDPKSVYKRSTFGRKKEDLPEHIHTRVEYASKSFLERISNEFAHFVGDEMAWVGNLPEYQKLLPYTQLKLQPAVASLRTLLKDYVRGTIYKLLSVNYDTLPKPDLPYEGGNDLYPRLDRAIVWSKLSANERILSRSFYEALISFKMFKGKSNLDIQEGWDQDWDTVKLTTMEKRELDRGTYREIMTEELKCLIRSFEPLFYNPQPQFALPDRTRNSYGGEVNSMEPDKDSIAPAQPIDIPRNPRSEENARDNDLASTPTYQNVYKKNDEWSWRPQPYLPDTGGSRCSVKNDGASQGDSLSSDESLTNGDQLGQRLAPKPIDFDPWCDDEKEWPGSSSKTGMKGIANRKSNSSWSAPIFFDLNNFFAQAAAHIESFALRKLARSDQSLRRESHELGLTNTLVCLQDDEWKYLPLWAGGNDDGSNGVFNDDLPIADYGFSSAGPEVHTGMSIPSSRATSEFDVVSSGSDSTSFNTSTATNRGFSDDIRRGHVYAADSAGTASSDDFTMLTHEEDEEENARRATEAQEQMEAAEEEEARRLAKGKGKMMYEDESYADFFNNDDDDEGDDTDRAEDEDFQGNEDEDDDMDMDMVMVEALEQ
ncbi:hypothetical protein MMC28_001794 [Mycoblastus sanguinarius]|nr:hypothetical protein [Mycoblastus sanguinarius]